MTDSGGRLSVADLVDQGDLDELLRRVDALCDNGEWAALLDLRDRCRAAFERGRQLWTAASHAEYRLALEAPGRWAGQVVLPGAGRFALGPLSEVAASRHTWEELAPHLPPTPEAALVAQERVLRDEDLRAVQLEPAFVELPLVLQDWEPAYPLAAYKPYSAEFEDVPPPPWEEVAVPAAGRGGVAEVVDDPDAVHALVELASAWTTQSTGRAAAVAVRGDAVGAIAALGVTGPAKLASVDADQALAVMAWAGASGGVHGRRRGMANGRFAAWWAAAALGRAIEDWPHVEDGLGRVRWYRWDRPEPATGWALRLAAERTGDGLAWAVEASDQP